MRLTAVLATVIALASTAVQANIMELMRPAKSDHRFDDWNFRTYAAFTPRPSKTVVTIIVEPTAV